MIKQVTWTWCYTVDSNRARASRLPISIYYQRRIVIDTLLIDGIKSLWIIGNGCGSLQVLPRGKVTPSLVTILQHPLNHSVFMIVRWSFQGVVLLIYQLRIQFCGISCCWTHRICVDVSTLWSRKINSVSSTYAGTASESGLMLSIMKLWVKS